MQFSLLENKAGQLVFPAPPTPVFPIGTLDSAARLRQLGAAGEITEMSAAGILADTTAIETQVIATVAALGQQPIIKNLMVSQSQYFNGGINTETDSWRAEHLTRSIPVAATVGGEIAVLDLCPALAGYRSCLKITHIWSDQTDAAIDLVFSTASGLTMGIVNLTIGTTAGQVDPEFGPGIFWEGSAVNEAIRVQAAAGQCQASQVFEFIGEIWYEVVP